MQQQRLGKETPNTEKGGSRDGSLRTPQETSVHLDVDQVVGTGAQGGLEKVCRTPRMVI